MPDEEIKTSEEPQASEDTEDRQPEKNPLDGIKAELFASSSDAVYLAEARVYIAGVLMPAMRVTITTTFGQMPRAEVALPAYSELLYLGEYDRVPVLVFVRESMVDCPEFILMFEGFITDAVYVNSALERTVAVHAISCFDILADAKVYFQKQLSDYFLSCVDGAKDQALLAVDSGMFLSFPKYFLHYGLVKPGYDLNNQDEHGPLQFPSDYLESVYAFLQKAHPPKGSEKDEDERENVDDTTWEEDPPLKSLHASALTSFYGKYARAFNFLGRFERLPYFDKKAANGQYGWDAASVPFSKDRATIFPMLYGIQTGNAMKALVDGIQRHFSDEKKIVTLLDLLTYLVNEMEYEYLVISNPAYHAPPENAAEKEVNSQYAFKADAPDYRGRLVSSCLKPIMVDAMPPGCNVMYRSMVNNVTVQFEHKGVPTRVRVRNAHSPLEILDAGAGTGHLSEFGLIDYYPSSKYKEFTPTDEVPLYTNFISSEMLGIEKYCGPWVREAATPMWLHYMSQSGYFEGPNAPVMQVGDEPVSPLKAFKERFLRRQLLMAKYALRQTQAHCVFDPYITPGFPGVIYDNEGSGFAFAGHVITVAHTITPSDVSTQVIMNFCRPLAEAVKIQIPNVLSFMHNITHKSEPLTEIYQTLLGTPFTEDASYLDNDEDNENSGSLDEDALAVLHSKFRRHLPGACAKTFKELEDKAWGVADPEDPNNSLKAAYLAKRRNICTFDRYCVFMGIEPLTDIGPEGSETPIMLNSKFLNDRRPLNITNTELVFDPFMPENEEIAGGGESQNSEIKTPEEDEAKSDSERKIFRIAEQMDVVTLLRRIAQREFEKAVYK